MSRGFTLIELSIVLVIIGLIVGGVLVGRDLIAAATIRAQVAQIESLNTAVNTFHGKFDALPGDIPGYLAARFGLASDAACDGSASGLRNGNNLIEGSGATLFTNVRGIAGYEAGLIWQDLSSSAGGNLIPGSFTGVVCASTDITSTGLAKAFPTSKMSNSIYVYAYNFSNINWWGITSFTSITGGNPSPPNPALTVMQAYSIDKKMDDGLAPTGNVVSQFIMGANIQPSINFSAPDPATCYETTGNTYNISQNNGTGVLCGVSFQFQ